MSNDSTGSLSTFSTETKVAQPVTHEKIVKLRRNGWSLYHAHPEARLKAVQKTKESHPDHVVILLVGLSQGECTKFLVHKSMTLEGFKQSIVQSFQLSRPVHPVFDGVSFPGTNTMADIYSARARDDRILHGYLVSLDRENGNISN